MKIKLKNNNNAQILVLESIIFAITVVIAIAFLIALSPTSIEDTSTSSVDLHIIGNDALNSLYCEQVSMAAYPYKGAETNNITNKLTVCIITNNYNEIIYSLNNILPNYIYYNLYIADPYGNKVFWCSSIGHNDPNDIMESFGTVFTSHRYICLDSAYLNEYEESVYTGNTESDLIQKFLPYGYQGELYDVILEMWSI